MPSRKEILEQAQEKAISSFMIDMPLLLHGSGDRLPARPETARALAALTAEYIRDLVGAALSAQDMLCDNDLSRKRPAPPPEFPRRRKITKAPLPGEKRGEYWDDDDDDGHHHHHHDNDNNHHDGSQAMAAVEGSQRKGTDVSAILSPDQWVGVTGVDWSEGRRLRTIHTAGPATLSTQCFIFPICHDAYAYGRVMELQAAKRSISQQLVDPAIAELLKDNELKQQQQQQQHDKEGEEPEESDKEEGMTWPGVEDVLPVYRDIDKAQLIYDDDDWNNSNSNNSNNVEELNHAVE